MARQKNSLGNYIAGDVALLKPNRRGAMLIDPEDPELLLPADVVDKMPDPFCRGMILHAAAAAERVMLHFPADPAYRDVAMTGLQLLTQIEEDLASPPGQKHLIVAEVTGDWYHHIAFSTKLLLFTLHTVEIKRVPRPELAPAFG